MSTIASPRAGFNFIGFALIVAAILVISSMALGGIATPVMTAADQSVVEADEAVVAAWDKGKEAWAAGDKVGVATAIVERQAADGQYIDAYNQAVCKAPAEMGDAELRAELDSAEVQVEAAWGAVATAHDKVSQAEYETALAARQAASERFVAANEAATARGWYKCAIYGSAEIATIAASVKVAATTDPIVTLPGLESPVYVSWTHIMERHGIGPFDLLADGPNNRRDCKEGKTYIFKKMPGARDKYVLGIIWNDVLVTAYEVTRDLLYYYFSADDCPPPLNGGHDGLSSPAY